MCSKLSNYQFEVILVLCWAPSEDLAGRARKSFDEKFLAIDDSAVGTGRCYIGGEERAGWGAKRTWSGTMNERQLTPIVDPKADRQDCPTLQPYRHLASDVHFRARRT
ncbi:hypothetical protein GCM10023219_19760 [Stakelama sediminis]